MHALITEFRYAARRLAMTPGFTLVCVLTIAIGMGAVTCVYSVVDTVLMKPYPYREPDRLMWLFLADPETSASNLIHEGERPPSWCFVDWREHCTAFESIAVLGTVRGFNMKPENGEPERVFGARVTGNFLDTLGVRAQQGRLLVPEDSATGAARVAVLSHGFWKRRFGADTSIVGKTVLFDNVPREIIGILPDVPLPRVQTGTDEYSEPQVWMPLSDPDFLKQDMQSLWGSGWAVFARLRPGVTLEEANADLAKATERFHAAAPRGGESPDKLENPERLPVVRMVTYHEFVTADARTLMWVFFGIAVIVLLIGAANVANLLLARSIEGHRENTIRAALGASPMSLGRLVFLESVLLCLLGGVLGVLIAYSAVPVMTSALPSFLPRTDEIAVDLRVLACTFGLSLLTALICGLVPALRLRNPELQSVLKEGGRSASAGRGHHFLRDGLVIGEIGIALVVLFCAVYFSNRLLHCLRVDLGFSPERLLTVQVDFRDVKTEDDIGQFYDRVVRGLNGLPDVEAAGAGYQVPLARSRVTAYRIIGNPEHTQDSQKLPAGLVNTVSAGFLEALGVPLKQGRLFTTQETLQSAPIMIVDDQFAERWFPNGDALGAQVQVDGALKASDYTIVGIVGHSVSWINERLYAEVYKPSEDSDRGEFCGQMFIPLSFGPTRDMFLLLRTKGDDPFSVLPSLRKVVSEANPGQPLFGIRSMEEIRYSALGVEQGLAIPAIVFALVGVLLASVGCYSTMAYRVAQRRHEIGARMALGATPVRIVLLVLRQASVLFVIGTALGVALVSASTTIDLTSIGLEPFNLRRANSWLLLGISTSLLLVIVYFSAYLSARLAARVDPLIALREE